MGYRISYGQAQIREEIPDIPEKNLLKWVIPALAVVLTAVLVLYIIGPAQLRDLLLPGDPAVTSSALESFAVSIKEGEGLGTAIHTFCQEIIDGAQLP